MRTLVIDTATAILSIALFDDQRLLAADHRHLGRGHAEALVSAIAAFPDGGRAERILVSCGPGSFTGIRVGLAAARALGFAWQAEVVGYDTLALIALAAQIPDGLPCAVAIAGGHGELFVAQPGLAATSLPADAAAAALTYEHVAGGAAPEIITRRGWGIAHAAEADARFALALAGPALLAEPRPVYGRAPDAKLAERAH